MNQFDRLRKISSSSLADADKTIRCLSHEIRRFNGNANMVGNARVSQVHNDFLGVLMALNSSQSGDVLVVNASATYCAVLGGLFCTEAERRGLAGIVVDGLIRDIDYIKTLKIPVYAKGCCPNAGSTNILPYEKTEILCGGVRISNGDILVGDGDGVVAIGKEELNQTIVVAAEIEKKEAIILNKLKAGRDLSSFLNLTQHVGNLKESRESEMRFIIDE